MHDKLFQLISSLSKNEKRYFRLFASTYKRDAQYLALFTLLEKQKEYDEESVKDLFRRKEITGQVHVVKHYLYRLIMKSLRSYHASATINAQLKEALSDVEILYHRGLYDQCEEILRRAKARAIENDHFHHMIEINIWERTLLLQRYPEGHVEAKRRLGEMYGEAKRWVKDLETVLDCRQAFDIIAAYHEEVRTPEALGELQRSIPPAIATGVGPEPTSYMARAQMLYTRMAYLFDIGEYDTHYACTLEFLDHVTEQPRYIQHRFVALDQLVRNRITTRRLAEARTRLQDLQTFFDTLDESMNAEQRAHFFFTSDEHRLNILIVGGEFEQAAEEGMGMERALEGYRRYLAPRRVMTFNLILAIAYFGARRYDLAIQRFNDVLSTPPSDATPLHQIWARMLQILLHVELGNLGLVEDLLRSYHRLLQKSNRLYRTEELMLRAIRLILGAAGSRALMEGLRGIHAEMKTLEDDPYEARAYDIFDFLSWIESRIEGKSFAEIVQRKALQWRGARAA